MALRHKRLTALVGTTSMIVVGFAPLLLAAPAQAADGKATAEVYSNIGSDVLSNFAYDGGPLRNEVSVILQETDEKFVFRVDDSVEVITGKNCTHPDSADLTMVTCEIPKSDERVAARFDFGAGSDVVSYTNATASKNFSFMTLGEGSDIYVATRPQAWDAWPNGGAGDDSIRAGTGASVSGGDGNDILTLLGGASGVHGGEGRDQVNGGVGDDLLFGDGGDDIIYGNDGDDEITGGAGNDELYGGRHNDTLYGNSGDDTIFGNSGDDYISGGPGSDTISGGAGNNTVVDV